MITGGKAGIANVVISCELGEVPVHARSVAITWTNARISLRSVLANAEGRPLQSESLKPRWGIRQRIVSVQNPLRHVAEGRGQTLPLVVNLVEIVPYETMAGKLFNERDNMPDCLLRHFPGVSVQGFGDLVDRMLSVKELPQVNTDRVQAKPTTGVGVEENGPIVKLLPEHDGRVGYGFLSVFHGSASPFPTAIVPHTEHQPIECGH